MRFESVRSAAGVCAGFLIAAASAGCILVTRAGPEGPSPKASEKSYPVAAGSPRPYERDSIEVAAAVNGFHRALESGDSATALGYLDNALVMLESGEIETRAAYRQHHLPADIAFSRAVPSTRGPLQVRVLGDVAWAWGASSSTGNFRGRAVNSIGAELMVLVWRGDRWRIAAVHWSSRQRRTAP